MTNKLRDHMTAAAGALLFAAFVMSSTDGERQITSGQTLGDTHALVATAQPCYCTETCQ